MMLGDGLYDSLGLVVTTGADDGHAGEHTHHADVFQNLAVGSTVFAQHEPAMMFIMYVVPYTVVYAHDR